MLLQTWEKGVSIVRGNLDLGAMPGLPHMPGVWMGTLNCGVTSAAWQWLPELQPAVYDVSAGVTLNTAFWGLGGLGFPAYPAATPPQKGTGHGGPQSRWKHLVLLKRTL